MVDLHRARRAHVVRRRSRLALRRGRSRSSIGVGGTRGAGLSTRGGPGGLLERTEERRAVRGPERACEVDGARARCGSGRLLLAGRAGLGGVGGGAGGEVPEGLPEDLEAGLDERERVGLRGGDARVDVGLVLEQEGLEVGRVDPGRALDAGRRVVDRVASESGRSMARGVKGEDDDEGEARTCVCGRARKRRKTVLASQ